MLASLTGPLPPDTERAADQTEIDLGEDVVTLSYERALHAHARYKPANLSVWEADSDAVAMAEPVGGARKAGGVGEKAGILLRARFGWYSQLNVLEERDRNRRRPGGSFLGRRAG